MLGYRKEKVQKGDENPTAGISDTIKNGIFYLVWIKDLPMLYYFIFDDEFI